jgi:dolichol-phosphate mannosyltransferase
LTVGETARGLVSIILATYNEAENIAQVIPAIVKQVPDPLEVIVVDDDSPDRTWEVAQNLGDGRVRVVRRIGARGLASAMMRGIMEARGELIGWIDADMAGQADVLPKLIARTQDCDVAVASRFVSGGSDERAALRVLASRAINGLAGLVLGGGIRDYDSNVAVVRRAVFDRALFNPRGYGEYFMEFLYHCRRRGLRICEVPYTLTARASGTSKSAPSLWRFFRQGIGYGLRIVTTRLGGAG